MLISSSVYYVDDIDAPLEEHDMLVLRPDWSTPDDVERPARRSSGGAALVARHRNELVPECPGVGRGSRRLSEGLLMIGSLWKSLGKSQGSSIQ